MKTKSNIILLTIIILIIGFNIFEVSQFKINNNKNIGITTHKLGYITCLSIEDNVKATISEGDSNLVKVSPEIEMFYSAGCLSIRGRGIANLTLQKNTLTALSLEKIASIEGVVGDSLQYIQSSGNSYAKIKGGVIDNLEINIKDNAKIKLNVKKIVNLTGKIRDVAVVKIYGKVDSSKIDNSAIKGKLEIIGK